MGFKPSSLKKEELENKIRAEDAAKAEAHEEEVAVRRAKVLEHSNSLPMQPVSAPMDPKEIRPRKDEPQYVWPMLQDIRDRLMKVETLVQTLALQANSGKVVVKEKPMTADFDSLDKGKMVPLPKSEKELAKTAAEVLANNKHKNGKPPAVVDVPTLEVLAAQMGKYIKRYGKGALETRLAQYDVKKASDIPEEKRHLFLQDIAT